MAGAIPGSAAVCPPQPPRRCLGPRYCLHCCHHPQSEPAPSEAAAGVAGGQGPGPAVQPPAAPTHASLVVLAAASAPDQPDCPRERRRARVSCWGNQGLRKYPPEAWQNLSPASWPPSCKSYRGQITFVEASRISQASPFFFFFF